MEPEITAVVVNYNSGELLRLAVQSLMQGSARLSIEVVDNASGDDSVKSIQDFESQGGVTVTRNRHNIGFAAANNQVLTSRKAKYFLLMNPDCRVHTRTVEILKKTMDAHSEVGICGCKLFNTDHTVQKTSKRRFPTPMTGLIRTLGLGRVLKAGGESLEFDLGDRQSTVNGDLEYVEAISGALMFVRSEALDRVGLLDESYFMHCEDLDWCMRFWKCGYKVAYVGEAEAVHVKGGSGRSPRVVWHLHRGMIRFYRKFYRDRYPLPVTLLVYAGVGLRGLVLMIVSLVRTRRFS